jgi:primosomal protein N' (replication factor Y)
VVLGLPVNVAFDYSIPKAFRKNIAVGARVLINFRNKKSVGYVVGLTHKSGIKNIKDILGVIDEKPLLGKENLLLAQKIADYYCSSYGEAIEAMVPKEIRIGKVVTGRDGSRSRREPSLPKRIVPTLLHDLEPMARWEIYIEEVKKAKAEGKSAIILFSDIQTVLKSKEIFENSQIKGIHLLYRKEKEEFAVWQEVRSEDNCVVLGTRSAVFAPVNSLGLIILDHEDDSVYKQEQVPHYHARQAALMRAEIEKAKVILESVSPTLGSFYLAQEKKIDYHLLKRQKAYPEIKVIDTKRMPYADRKNRAILSRSLIDAILSVLNSKGKTLVFINRRGFATYAACHNCGKALKCPACNISLVYHFDQGILRCHHCSFKMVPPKICPNCNCGYIKYSGIGTDKIESELSRIFPQARIGEDIVVSTSLILKEDGRNFDLICVLNIDSAINRVDYMAAEKVFHLLSGLVTLTDKKIIIPTNFPEHHCFKSLVKADPQIFYGQELKFRKQLKYPPFRYMALVRARGRDEEKVKKAAEALFEKLKAGIKGVEALSINPGDPPKLRGNFYWQILFSAVSPKKLSKFLKINLKDFRYSGIIVTVDIDPV